MHYSLINSIHVSRQIDNKLNTDELYVAIACLVFKIMLHNSKNSFCMCTSMTAVLGIWHSYYKETLMSVS